MNAPARFPLTADWTALLKTARIHMGSQRARWAISLLHHEATQLSTPGQSCAWQLNRAIADACQCFVDCPCEDCLDELARLMADDDYTPTTDVRGVDSAHLFGQVS